MLLDFLKQKRECQHKNVPIDVDEAYCPDCGALVHNQWFLVRCSCCNIKRTAHTQYDEIKPNTKFCLNCGATDFYIEELDKVNFIDVHYAVFKKITIHQGKFSTNQIWIEDEGITLQEKKLLMTGK